MTSRKNVTISDAHALVVTGRFESVISLLKPIIASDSVKRDQKLEALALCATACHQLSWYEEEVLFRTKRLSLVRSAGIAEARERTALARAQVSLGRLADAEKAIKGIDKKWGRLEWAEYLQAKALIHLRQTRDYTRAAALLEEALALLNKAGSSFEQGRAKVLLGHALRFDHQLQKACAWFKEAQNDLSGLMDRNPAALMEFANSEFFLGDIERLMGNLDVALSLYQRSSKLLGGRASLHFIYRYYQRLGSVYFQLEDFEKARTCYLHEKRMAAVERIGNLENFFWCYYAAAKTHTAQKDAAQAKDMLREAEKCVKPVKTLYQAGHVSLLQGEIFEASGEPLQARACFQDAQASFSRIGANGHQPGMADALYHLGMIALEAGDLKEAINMARQCAELAAETGFLSIQSKALMLKSHILVAGDDDLDDMFHDILKRVDMIHSPAMMFKVLSNIYYYAHKFCDYEIDVSIEKRLAALRKVLDSATHARLYHDHIDKKYADLIRNHLTRNHLMASGE